MTTSDRGRGHVFVVHGDLAALACDDLIVPTDAVLEVNEHWHDLVPHPLSLDHLDVDGAGWRRQRCARVVGRPGTWVVDTGGSADTDISWYVDGLRSALDAVAAYRATEGLPPARERERALVALPLVGVGKGGAGKRRGDVIGAILDLLEKHAADGHDVALVLNNPRDHGAVQHVRRGRACHDLSSEETETAEALAARARSGALALFLGAGVSMSAGLPSWSGLLDLLADRAGFDADDRERLRKMPPQDAATLVAKHLGDGLREALIVELASNHYGLSHALLAALPVREAVTTNYDALFERAWTAVGRAPAVMPWSAPSASSPWLLKLHGDLEEPEGLVLTREEYLRFAGTRGALAGVVQGLLMTRHVLFAGFGLADENFLKLADDVQQVRGGGGTVGTVLQLVDDPLRRQLWEGRLDNVAFEPADGSDAVAARRLEIFLDLVAHEATDDASFLLDDRYKALLGEDDRELAKAVAPLTAVSGSSGAAVAVRGLVTRLGGQPEAVVRGGRGGSQSPNERAADEPVPDAQLRERHALGTREEAAADGHISAGPSPRHHRSKLGPCEMDRAVGAMTGAAAGDALGVPYEFKPRLHVDEAAQMVGGGLGDYEPGQWSDDTEMATAILAVAARGLDLRTDEALDLIAEGFLTWYATNPPDVGNQTRQVLGTTRRGGTGPGVGARMREAADELHASTGHTAGNGSLMRTSPVALAHLGDPDAIAEAARAISGLTHADPTAGDACVLWCLAIDHAVHTGIADVRVGLGRVDPSWAALIDEAEQKAPHEFDRNGWVVTALQAAWSAIHHTSSLESGLQAAVHAGHDTDTVAAIAGGLLGASYGGSAVPARWRRISHGYPGWHHRDLVRHAVLAARGGRPDAGGWPTATTLDPESERWTEPHPDDPGVILGPIASLRPDVAEAAVSLCRIGTEQGLGTGTDLRDHIEVWFVDQDGRNNDVAGLLRDIAEVVRDLRNEGKTVFLHCHGGRSRTLVAAAAYGALHTGTSRRDALARVTEVLPEPHPRQEFLDALDALDDER